LDWRWVRRPHPHDRAGQEGHVHDQCRKSPDREKDTPAQGKERPEREGSVATLLRILLHQPNDEGVAPVCINFGVGLVSAVMP
jgi:hypothetical protein